NSGQPQKIVFEIVQIPRDRLAIEAFARITHGVVKITSCRDLKTRQDRDCFTVGIDHDGRNAITGPILRQELKERQLAQVFLNVGVAAEVFTVDFRHGQSMTPEMLGEFEECNVFLANSINDADRRVRVIRQPENVSAGAAELALNGSDSLGRRLKM